MLAVLQADNSDAKARAVKRTERRMRIGVNLKDIDGPAPYQGVL